MMSDKTEMPTMLWKGQNIDEMPREDLIDALKQFGHMHDEQIKELIRRSKFKRGVNQ